jgi:hypothetical protein
MNPTLVEHFLNLVREKGLDVAKEYAKTLNAKGDATGRRLLNSIGEYQRHSWERNEELNAKSVALRIRNNLLDRNRDLALSEAVDRMLEDGDIDCAISSVLR